MAGEIVILVCIGLAAGVLGGLLGIGGSILMIPAMSLVFGPKQHLYQGAAMIVNFFVVLPAFIQHRRAGAILRPIVRVMIPAAALAVIGGVWLSRGPWFAGTNEVYLSRVFGAFLLYAAAWNVYRLFSTRPLPNMSEDDARRIPMWKTGLLVGVPMGISGGLLGIGGGVVAVPLQQVFLRVPIRRAIANSATTIILLSLIGATYKNYTNVGMGISLVESLRLAGCLIPTAIVGGFVGGRLTHVAPRRVLRVAVILLMCYAGIRFLGRPLETEQAQTQPASTQSGGISEPLSGLFTAVLMPLRGTLKT